MGKYLIKFKDIYKDNRLEFAYGNNEQEAIFDLVFYLQSINNSVDEISSINFYSTTESKNNRLMTI